MEQELTPPTRLAQRSHDPDPPQALFTPAGLPPACLHPATPLLPLLPRRGDHPPPERHVHARRLEQLGRLTSGIVHDVNNLLAVVLGEADLLLSHSDPPDRQQIEAIRNAALRARSLTRSVLSRARDEDGSPRPLDVAEALSDTVGFLARLAGPDVHVRARFHEGLPRVLMAPRRLDQVVMNLAVNARDAMPEGGVLEITADADAGLAQSRGGGGRPAGVRIRVSDTGVGMPEETRRRIFERFFTTKGPDSGTGLGLATVAEIVRDAGGRIDVDSRPGAGSTFTVHLPSAPLEWSLARRNGTGERADSRGGSAGEAPRPTILVVDDEDEVRAVVSRCLTRDGYPVIEAASGAEALEAAGAAGPALRLVLADVNLPDTGGERLWRELSREIMGMRVIFMSGFERADLTDLDLDQKRGGFLAKPFQMDELLAEVHRVLDG